MIYTLCSVSPGEYVHQFKGFSIHHQCQAAAAGRAIEAGEALVVVVLEVAAEAELHVVEELVDAVVEVNTVEASTEDLEVAYIGEVFIFLFSVRYVC